MPQGPTYLYVPGKRVPATDVRYVPPTVATQVHVLDSEARAADRAADLAAEFAAGSPPPC